MLTNTEFREISNKETCRRRGLREVDWRRRYARQIMEESNFNWKATYFTLTLPNGEDREVGSSRDIYSRLEDVLFQLLTSKQNSCKDTWIKKLRKEYGVENRGFDFPDIRAMNFRIEPLAADLKEKQKF